ncbi:MAG: hypothetical protein ACOZQL_08470 [Myxococcota bacterium]
MPRRVWLALLVLAACGKKLEGPTPSLDAVSPDALCVEQRSTTLALSGGGLAALMVDGLTTSPHLVLPSATLTRTVELSGASASGAVDFSGEPEGANASLLAWTSQAELRATVTPALALAPGLYDVTVTLASGASATRPGSVLAVPRPTLTSLSQDLACLARDTTLTLSGDLLVRHGVDLPSVAVGSRTLTPTLADCRALPGTGGYEACRSLEIVVPANSQPPGTVDVTVTNPAPLACVSAVRTATWVDRPKVTSVQPLAVCSAAAMQQLEVRGVGFLTVDGVGPALTVGAQRFTPSASGCAPLTGPTETAQLCTTLTLTVPAGTFTPGDYPVVVTNPAPADCASSDTVTLTVRPPPVVTDVAPRNLCSGNATLTVTGTGFVPGATVSLGGIAAVSVSVADAGTSAAASFAMIEPGGPFQVVLDNGDGCSATATATVNVIPGPQLFFVDPPVAFNGLTTQATAYGTGFTGTVTSVSLVPRGGGASVPLQYTTNAARPGQVQVLIPAGTAAGDYDVTLTDGSTCGARLLDGVRIVDQTTVMLATPALTPGFGHLGESTGITLEAQGGLVAVPRVYLNPTNATSTTVAAPLGAVAYLNARRLTGLVPGSLPVGSYDVIVVNPDGTVGLAPSAFRVVAQPPPVITALSPGSVANANPQTFTINGTAFRQPAVSLSCVDGSGAPLAMNPAATVTASSASSVDVRFDASAAGVACVVRVTNGDDATFSDFSALVITNPAQNLYAAQAGPSLAIARRAPVVLGGNATTAARYLHVIGGDDGARPLATVETSALDVLGVPGPFVTQRYQLEQPRTNAAGANVGRFLYVAGGADDAGVALDTIERAVVLDPDEREEVTDLLLEVGAQGLDAGTWYYRVAAVMDASDPFNPGGENLASDPFPVRLPELQSRKLSVTVSWRTQPGATKYVVYRSPSPGAAAGTEQVIAEVNAPTTSFKDTGLAPTSTQTPLFVGSTGRWHTLAARLSAPREGPGVAWAIDPAAPTQAWLYVLGGRQSSSAASATYDRLGLTLAPNGAQTAGASVTSASGLGAARWQLAAAQATNALSSRIAAGTTYVYALSGLAAGGALVNTAEAAPVQAGGALGTFVALDNLQRAGYGTIVAGNHVFAFGGLQGSPDTGVVSGEICGPGVSGCGAVAQQVPPRIVNWNAGQSMRTARYRLGATLSGAFIYVAGGTTSSAAASSSTEYRLW